MVFAAAKAQRGHGTKAKGGIVTVKENNLYIYAVTRVHGSEQSLLNERDLAQLAAAADAAECFRILGDHGWGGPECPPNDADALVAYETERTWGLIEELVGDLSPFNVFLYANDYHNLKAAIKFTYSAPEELSPDELFIHHGTVEPEQILIAAREHDFSGLPEALAEAGLAAYQALAHTGNGQACDLVIDQAALQAIWKAGESSGSEVLRRYAAITVDAANIKSAVRCCLMRRGREFLETALAKCGTLDTELLMDAATRDLDAICEYLSMTEYGAAVDVLRTSMAAFEKWCDNQMVEMIRPQRYQCFTLEPLAAFILGRENEIRMVRLILSGKINRLDNASILERLRETYV